MNIVFLMTDQLRNDCVGYNSARESTTPNIDRIAEGVSFTRCQTVNPICQPARTALLTGRYSHQIGTLQMSGDLNFNVPTYAQALPLATWSLLLTKRSMTFFLQAMANSPTIRNRHFGNYVAPTKPQ